MVSAEFLDKTKSLPPDPLLVKALTYLGQGRVALDLGAGAGRDTRYLLEQGFQVTAVDQDPKAAAILKKPAGSRPFGNCHSSIRPVPICQI